MYVCMYVQQFRNQWSSVHMSFRVAKIFSDRLGKFESGAQNMVVADYNTFMAHMAGMLSLQIVCVVRAL